MQVLQYLWCIFFDVIECFLNKCVIYAICYMESGYFLISDVHQSHLGNWGKTAHTLTSAMYFPKVRDGAWVGVGTSSQVTLVCSSGDYHSEGNVKSHGFSLVALTTWAHGPQCCAC